MKYAVGTPIKIADKGVNEKLKNATGVVLQSTSSKTKITLDPGTHTWVHDTVELHNQYLTADEPVIQVHKGDRVVIKNPDFTNKALYGESSSHPYHALHGATGVVEAEPSHFTDMVTVKLDGHIKWGSNKPAFDPSKLLPASENPLVDLLAHSLLAEGYPPEDLKVVREVARRLLVHLDTRNVTVSVPIGNGDWVSNSTTDMTPKDVLWAQYSAENPTPLIKEVDPELEKLLAEEEEIEAMQAAAKFDANQMDLTDQARVILLGEFSKNPGGTYVIQAIKELRAGSNLGLKEAKDVIDNAHADLKNEGLIPGNPHKTDQLI